MHAGDVLLGRPSDSSPPQHLAEMLAVQSAATGGCKLAACFCQLQIQGESSQSQSLCTMLEVVAPSHLHSITKPGKFMWTIVSFLRASCPLVEHLMPGLRTHGS